MHRSIIISLDCIGFCGVFISDHNLSHRETFEKKVSRARETEVKSEMSLFLTNMKPMDELQINTYLKRLWPICRSLTGNGLRESLHILNEIIPLNLIEVPSGTQVFDWQIPDEWNIESAVLINPNGEVIADLAVNNLHVVNYSIPVEGEFTYDQLKAHIYTLEEQPTVIPYITSYYKRNWGFCLAHHVWNKQPKDGVYKVQIKSSLEPGSLTYGECVLKGESDEEILISTYVCHPSMANNELSGPIVAAGLYSRLASLPKRRFTYRFLFAPETIGVIAFLSKEGEQLKKKLHAGYVATTCGDRGPLTYKLSKRGDTAADRAAMHVLHFCDKPHAIIPFSVGGSDERQYCSPGFNLPVGSIMRTPYQRYKEYHTSGDNLDFITAEHLLDTIKIYFDVIQALEMNRKYYNIVQCGEPQMGKRGLYPDSSAPNIDRDYIHRLMHFLSYADGETDVLEIAAKRNESIHLYQPIIEACLKVSIIEARD
jgi:aminopeptidase-like protein